MPSPRLLVLSGFAVSALELVLAGGLAIGLGAQRVSLVLAVSAVLTAALAVAIEPLLRPRGERGVRAETGADDPEPPWWPEFERDLREHMRERERTPVR